MNGRERLLAALTEGLSRDFPVVIPYLGIFLRDHWDEVTDKPWWSIWDIEERLEVEEDLEREVSRQIEVGREYGKFVVSLGSPVTPRTPVGRVKEYVEAARRCGRR